MQPKSGPSALFRTPSRLGNARACAMPRLGRAAEASFATCRDLSFAMPRLGRAAEASFATFPNVFRANFELKVGTFCGGGAGAFFSTFRGVVRKLASWTFCRGGVTGAGPRGEPRLAWRGCFLGECVSGSAGAFRFNERTCVHFRKSS